MAFVEVIRRSMRPEEWTDLRYGWIKRGLIQSRHEITGLSIRDACQTGEDEYRFLTDYRPLTTGDLYFTPDGTVFIRGHVTIPTHLKEKEIWLHLHTAAEMIVKINGSFAGGIDPNRDRILINPWLAPGSQEFDLEIEGYNRSKPDDERNPDALASRGCRQIFEGAWLVELNRPLLSLYYDLTLLLDIAKSRHFDEDYRAYLNRELDHALNKIDFDTWEGVSEASRSIEERIYQNTDFRSSGNVALIAHSHLDIAYYWRRIHATQKNARTVLIQMRLMDQYPDFHYAHTQPYTYELLSKYYPELFSELCEKIKSGQFEPVGAMYVEPDCNIPNAESLIRQCLYGQHFYRKAFGITVESAWLPDVFGNSWILPQILKKSGVRYFVSNKMSTWNDTNRFPHNHFLWKGIDGSRIYACVPPTHFITWNMPSQIQENWDAYQDKETGGQTLSMFGYGDGGSGVTEEMIELMHRFDRLSIMPKTEHMRADTFLHKNFDGNPDLETWDGELYLEMHRGTFTTKALLKDYNRRLEFKLRTAELLSVLRARDGAEYPADFLKECYQMLLLNQFHDILPGSHIHPVFEDAVRDYQKLEARLDAWIDDSETAVKTCLFNPLNMTRDDVIFLPDAGGSFVRKGMTGRFVLLHLPALGCATIRAAETSGVAEIGAVQTGAAGIGAVGTGAAGICATGIGAVGTSVAQTGTANTDDARYEGIEHREPEIDDFKNHNADTDCLQRLKTADGWLFTEKTADRLCADTPFYSIRFLPDGSIESLYDKEANREWVKGGFNRLHLYQDTPGMYDAWDILPNYKDVEYPFELLTPFHLCQADEQAAELRAVLATPGRKSRWEMVIRLFANSRLIEVEHVVDWKEKHRLAKAEFSCNVLSRELLCDTSAGYIRRETHTNTSWQKARFEVCQHNWCDFSEESGGIALINENKYGVSPEETGFSISLLRANIRPDILSDIGHHDFCYAILPHVGSAVHAKINQRALAYNIPLVRTAPFAPPLRTFEPLYLQAAKRSEDGRFLVLRLSEQDGMRGTLRLPWTVQQMNMLEDIEGEGDTLSYTPFEILTIGIPWDRIGEALAPA